MTPPDSASQASSVPTAPDLAANSDGSDVVETLFEAAARVLRRRFRVLVLVREAYERMTAHPNVLSAVWTDLQTLLRLLIRWADQSYRQISWTPLLLLVAVLIYFLTPVDLIPDALGPLGFLDDVTVISTVVERLRHELDRFRRWEQTHIRRD